MASPQLYDMCQREGCLHERGKHEMRSRSGIQGIFWGRCKMRGCKCNKFVGDG